MRQCAPLTAAAILLVQFLTLGQSTDVSSTLQEADRMAWLTDWYGALPLYQRAEKEALRLRDPRSAMYARFGRLRGEMQAIPLPDIAEQIASDLETAVARADARLRLRGLTVKGDIDLEWDVQAAQQDWEQVTQLARELGDKGWEYRATGERALVAFLKGNTGQASALIQQALQAVTAAGDIGGQIRYMGAIANGVLMA